MGIPRNKALTIKKRGSLLLTNPYLAKEWSEKNKLQVGDVTAGSNKKAWWKCRVCGYEWQAVIASRDAGSGCPECSKRSHSSFPEQAIFYYVKNENEDAINGYKEIFDNNMELDVFIPSRRIGIEYDGKAWHKGEYSNRKEELKYEICKKHKIYLIRIREFGCTDISNIADNIIVIKEGSGFGNLTKAIEELKQIIGLSVDIDVDRDQNKIREGYYNNVEERSLQAKFPEIAKEWNKKKNGKLTPKMVYGVTGDIVWWKCKQGHEWQASIANRVKGRKCPFCSGHKVLSGDNDLYSTSPDIAKEWNYDKNKDVSPWEISESSNKKVWWKCDKGHEWEAVVYSRKNGTKCPYCTNQKVLEGFNDLFTNDKELGCGKNESTIEGYIPGCGLAGTVDHYELGCGKTDYATAGEDATIASATIVYE